MYLGNKLYQRFFKAYCSCHLASSQVSGSHIIFLVSYLDFQAANQAKANELWLTIKPKDAAEVNLDLYNSTVQDLEVRAERLKERKDIRTFFKANVVNVVANEQEQPEPPPPVADQVAVQVAAELEEQAETHPETVVVKRVKPAQVKLEEDLKKTKLSIENLKSAKVLATSEEREVEINKQLRVLDALLIDQQKKLSKAQQNEKAQIKLREKRRNVMEEVQRKYPEIATQLKTKTTVGRPRVEADQPDLLRDVLEIATIGAAASEKRREEVFRTVKTLDDLKAAISEMGYTLSRTALYYRLQPRSTRSIAGKRHVETVPVRLVR